MGLLLGVGVGEFSCGKLVPFGNRSGLTWLIVSSCSYSGGSGGGGVLYR